MSTRRFEYVLLDVFTKRRLEGNPLAVFPSASGIIESEMQRIARELNLSETVFMLKAKAPEAVARIRIYTPRRELDFAGHPTIGSAYVFAKDREGGGRFALEENVGLIPIETDFDETGGTPRFWLTTPPVTFLGARDAALCARLINMAETDLVTGVVPELVSAGSPLLFICLTTPQAVDRAEFNMAYLAEAFGDVDAVGTFLFARKERESHTCFDVYSRMFAPHTGIPEDPATGGAAGPLAGYMLRYGLLPTDKNLLFTNEQGTKMGRRSTIFIRITGDEPTIQVGGSVVTVAEGTFLLDSVEA